MSRKQKTTQTNTYGYMTPPETRDTTALRELVNQSPDYAGQVRGAFSAGSRLLDRQYKNPLGAFTTQNVRDQVNAETTATRSQQLGLDLAAAANQAASDKFNRQAAVAGFTQPNLVQTGGTSVQKTPFNWMDGLQIAGNRAGAAAG